MRILAVGLDETTVSFLLHNGVAVKLEEIEDTAALQSKLSNGLYDAAVFDLDASNIGVYAPRSLREQKIDTPVVGISRGSEGNSWSDHRATFLENGGDALLRGPTNPRELVASLRAVTRRFKGALLDIVECWYGDAVLKVNLTTHSVTVNGDDACLSASQTRLMLALASSPGRVLSKEMILGDMYIVDVAQEPEMKIIDVFICKIRDRLGAIHPDAGGEHFVETIWGRGYRLRGHPESSKKEKAA